MNTKDKVQEVFRKVFQRPMLKIEPHTTARDISLWDSLTHMELIAEIEKTCSIQFSLDEVMSFKCVGDMIKCIDKKQE